MSTLDDHTLRRRLREVLRVARFYNWTLDKVEDEISKLFRGEVDEQPAPTPDQIPGPQPV